MPSDQLERLNSELAGRYALERELAQAGMATVDRIVPVHQSTIPSEIQGSARQDEPGLTGRHA